MLMNIGGTLCSGEWPDGSGLLRLKLLWRKLWNICSADSHHLFLLALCLSVVGGLEVV